MTNFLSAKLRCLLTLALFIIIISISISIIMMIMTGHLLKQQAKLY